MPRANISRPPLRTRSPTPGFAEPARPDPEKASARSRPPTAGPRPWPRQSPDSESGERNRSRARTPPALPRDDEAAPNAVLAPRRGDSGIGGRHRPAPVFPQRGPRQRASCGPIRLRRRAGNGVGAERRGILRWTLACSAYLRCLSILPVELTLRPAARPAGTAPDSELNTLRAGPFGAGQGAKANGLEPYDYLRHVFTELPTAGASSDVKRRIARDARCPSGPLRATPALTPGNCVVSSIAAHTNGVQRKRRVRKCQSITSP